MNVRYRPVTYLALAFGILASSPALAQGTAFRFADLDLRDPHVFVDFIGCRDVTDTPFLGFSVNGELQASIQTDGDMPPDGFLDLSYLVEFLPLDQSQATNLIDTSTANCTAPLAGTTCSGTIPLGIAGDATLQSASTCLAPIAGTMRPYSPAITSSGVPCFVSPMQTITLDLGGIPVTLRDAQIGATFVDNPATTLANGLLRGFISVTDANSTIIPASLPLVGGMPLSSLLPGGQGNCAGFSDVDIHNGVQGWWFYLNFTAPNVPIIDPFANGFADSFE